MPSSPAYAAASPAYDPASPSYTRDGWSSASYVPVSSPISYERDLDGLGGLEYDAENMDVT